MTNRNNLWIAILVSLIAIPAQAGRAQSGAAQAPPQAGTPAPGAAPQHVAATTDPTYIIGAQDVLDISVWKEAELTRVVPVRPDGRISLPLLNDVQAAGLTPTQLADEITTSLKHFVSDPQVTVIVSQINSQRIYVLGEALRPGAYPLLPGMTVLQALSSAGGFSQFANLKKIYVLRGSGAKQEKFPFNYKEVIKGEHGEQNVELKAGDQIVIP